MTYGFLTISNQPDGQGLVRRPRATDVIGQALRGTFSEARGLPEDMARMLRQLDRVHAG